MGIISTTLMKTSCWWGSSQPFWRAWACRAAFLKGSNAGAEWGNYVGFLGAADPPSLGTKGINNAYLCAFNSLATGSGLMCMYHQCNFMSSGPTGIILFFFKSLFQCNCCLFCHFSVDNYSSKTRELLKIVSGGCGLH